MGSTYAGQSLFESRTDAEAVLVPRPECFSGQVESEVLESLSHQAPALFFFRARKCRPEFRRCLYCKSQIWLRSDLQSLCQSSHAV